MGHSTSITLKADKACIGSSVHPVLVPVCLISVPVYLVLVPVCLVLVPVCLILVPVCLVLVPVCLVLVPVSLIGSSLSYIGFSLSRIGFSLSRIGSSLSASSAIILVPVHQCPVLVPVWLVSVPLCSSCCPSSSLYTQPMSYVVTFPQYPYELLCCCQEAMPPPVVKVEAGSDVRCCTTHYTLAFRAETIDSLLSVISN